MKNEKTKQLEARLIEVFGDSASIAITNARLGSKGYYTRIESYGLPFRIEAHKDSQEDAEELALSEFKKQMEIAIKEKLFQTQLDDCYEIYELSSNELNKLYQSVDIYDKETLSNIKNQTAAKICKLDNGKFECVINSPYMQLHSRSTSDTKRSAVAKAIWVAHDIFNPYPIKIGNWPIK